MSYADFITVTTGTPDGYGGQSFSADNLDEDIHAVWLADQICEIQEDEPALDEEAFVEGWIQAVCEVFAKVEAEL